MSDRNVKRLVCFNGLVALVMGIIVVVSFATASAPPAKVDDCCKLCKCGPECKCPGCPNNAIKRPPIIQTPAPKPKAVADPVSFEDALRDQIESRPETIRSRRVLNVLEMEDGPRRQRILHRMERHTITHLDLKGEAGKIDWSSIDWEKVFEFVMKLLAAILPLLLMASAETGIPIDVLCTMVFEQGVPVEVLWMLMC